MTFEQIGTSQQEHIAISEDGALRLDARAAAAPPIYGSFQQFGYTLSPAQRFSTAFDQLRLDYVAQTPAGSAVYVDVRASADGARWTSWETQLASGADVTFDTPMRFAQYRATLLGNGASPLVEAVTLSPTAARPRYTAFSANDGPVAPTFRVHATRMGMVGGRTANGYIIKKRDHFVSLPSWRSLSSKNGGEYMVRITYKGRSSVAPVMDVGPWNTKDNYWDSKRDRFGDLPRGWPEDHAAYFDGYNKGRAEKGRVNAPTAIDIGDGVWWDDLGIDSGRAEVEVTFLWLGRDPGGAATADAPQQKPATPDATAAAVAAPAEPTAAPTAAPTATPAPQPVTAVVSNRDAAFKPASGADLRGSPPECSDDAKSQWAPSVEKADEGVTTARWQPIIAADALYDVYVHVPACDIGRKATDAASYTVQHRDGTATIVVNQAESAGAWVLLGRFAFRVGDGGFVELNSLTGEDKRVVWFDAAKWVPAK